MVGYSKNVQQWADNLAKLRSHFIVRQNIIDPVDSFLRQSAYTLHSDRDNRQVIFEQINSGLHFKGKF